MVEKRHGKYVWFFPDGDIPLPGGGGNSMHGHESLIILNPNEENAAVVLTVFYENREPDVLEPFDVGPQRVRCIRTSDPIGQYQIPRGQYALKLCSSAPVICQMGRADVCQSNLAYYTTMGYTD